MAAAAPRPRGDQVRDLVMALILILWTIFGATAVYELFTSGARVLESLPPFWFWGLPVTPYIAMYAPWRSLLPGAAAPAPPPPPVPPEPAPEAAQ